MRTIATMGLAAALCGLAISAEAEPLGRIETAAAMPRIRLAITTSCDDRGQASLRLTNRGPTWPAVAAFRLHRSSDGRLLAERAIRLKEGQTISFNVPEDRSGGGYVRLEVVPSWDPDNGRDAAIRCEQAPF